MNQISEVAKMLGLELNERFLIFLAESNQKVITSFRFTQDGIEHSFMENGVEIWEEDRYPTLLRLATGMYEAVKCSTLTNEEWRDRFRKWNEYYDKYRYKTHKLEGENNRLAEFLELVGLKVGEIFLLYDVDVEKRKSSLFRFSSNDLEIFSFGLFSDEPSYWESRFIYSSEDVLLRLITGKAIALHGDEIKNEKIVEEYYEKISQKSTD